MFRWGPNKVTAKTVAIFGIMAAASVSTPVPNCQCDFSKPFYSLKDVPYQMIGGSFAAIRPKRVATASSVVTDANVTSINSNGWSNTGTWSGVGKNPSSSFIVVSTAGYDATGSITSYTRYVTNTQRVRNAYNTQNTLTTDQMAQSSYIYADDVISGVTNNSTIHSPVSCANWSMLEYMVVGNTLTVSIVATHRNGPVICIKATATDGTTTVNAIATAPTKRQLTGDPYYLPEYLLTFDLTTLADISAITVDASVYPKYGVSASVLSTSATSKMRDFSSRRFMKWVSRATNPPIAYVNASTGNDGTGVWSATPATAQALPFATVWGARDQIMGVAFSAAFGGKFADGAQIRCGTGTWSLGNHIPSTDWIGQKGACLIVTSDERVSVSGVLFTIDGTGSADCHPQLAQGLVTGFAEYSIMFSGINIKRIADGQIKGDGANDVNKPTRYYFQNIPSFDNNSLTSSMLGGPSAYIQGVTVVNPGTGCFQAVDDFSGASEAIQWRMYRGLTVSGNALEGYLTLACSLTTCGYGQGTSGSYTGAIFLNNYYWKSGADTIRMGNLNTSATNNCWIEGNTCEYTSTVNNEFLFAHADGSNESSSNIIVRYNTFAGFDLYGRINWMYDQTGTLTAKLSVLQNNIIVSLDNKGDIFSTNGAFNGNFPEYYYVDSFQNFIQYTDVGGGASGGNLDQGSACVAYVDPKTSLGTSHTVGLDPQFNSPQATTSGPTAGTGNGDYSLKNTSPCYRVVSTPWRICDALGNVVGANDNIGSIAA